MSANALLALNLRVARERKGWTQAEAGKRIGRTRQTLIAWENPESSTKPDEETLQAVARVYGVLARDLRYARSTVHYDPPKEPGDVDPAEAHMMDQEWEPPGLPPGLEIMALDFEKEALGAGADRKFMRFARATMHEPSLVQMFVGGHNEKPMSVAEQRAEFEAVIDALRIILKKRIERLKRR